ncbi:39861_t:CDS:1, partial [Gigaspora margarita]
NTLSKLYYSYEEDFVDLVCWLKEHLMKFSKFQDSGSAITLNKLDVD